MVKENQNGRTKALTGVISIVPFKPSHTFGLPVGRRREGVRVPLFVPGYLNENSKVSRSPSTLAFLHLNPKSFLS